MINHNRSKIESDARKADKRAAGDQDQANLNCYDESRSRGALVNRFEEEKTLQDEQGHKNEFQNRHDLLENNSQLHIYGEENDDEDDE